MSTPAPLVGRDGELGELVRAAGLGPPVRAAAVLLSGDAGIGKSRLLAALAEQAAERGWRVATGHCLDLGGSPLPYLPFTEIAGRLVAARPSLGEQLLARWPALGRLLGRGPVAEPAGRTVDRGALFEAVHGALAELARAGPLLVLLEDLHWADRSTLDLLSYLLTRGFEVPVSLVASYRGEDLHRRHPLRTVAAGWARLPGVRRLELPPLPDADVRVLVQQLHPTPLAEPELQALVRRAEGNAFFAEELAAAGSATLPADLAGLLLVRVDALDPDARLVVQAAALAGRAVAEDVLAASTGLADSRFAAALRAAVEFSVLVPDEDGYRFRHAMLAEAVHDDLLPGERRRLHAAFVAALTRPGSRGTPADVARHALAAQDTRTAVAASIRAGDEAAAAGGPAEAAQHYATALDLLVEGADRDLSAGIDVVGLAVQAAAAAEAAGHVRRAEAVVADQLARLPADADPEDRARLLVALAEAALLSESGTDEVAAAAEAVALVAAEPPTLLRSRAVASYALALSRRREDVDAVRWAEEALAMPPELRAGGVTAALQTVLARASERGGDPTTGRRLLEQTLAAVRGTGDPGEVRLLVQLATIELEQGALRSALAGYTEAARRSAELGRPWAPYGTDARVAAGLAAYQLGEWDLARRLADAGADVPPLAAAGLAGVELAVRAGRGDRGAWIDMLDATRAQWTTDGMVAIHASAAAIELHGLDGRPERALAAYEEVVQVIRALWRLPDFQAQIRLAALLLGQLVTAVGVAGAGRADLLARAERIAEEAAAARGMGRRREPGPESTAWLARLQAERLRVRHAAGEPVPASAAVRAWEAAVEGFVRYEEPYERARSTARLAAALRAAGEERRAGELAAQAEEVATRLRARPLLEELRPLTRARAPAGVEVLTPREVEVLRLVAEGLSNGEIGARLYVSTKTASVHVSHILAKLGARSRTEAAAVARRRDLIR